MAEHGLTLSTLIIYCACVGALFYVVRCLYLGFTPYFYHAYVDSFEEDQSSDGGDVTFQPEPRSGYIFSYVMFAALGLIVPICSVFATKADYVVSLRSFISASCCCSFYAFFLLYGYIVDCEYEYKLRLSILQLENELETSNRGQFHVGQISGSTAERISSGISNSVTDRVESESSGSSSRRTNPGIIVLH
eukprot:snap_masked-scaffold_1-processed-gene-29.19-mRNA-1 protein AED:1.00 eAED:1.00 QI:0/0/0/0/1/1/2/0/190